MPEATYKIGELSQCTGFSIQTLRYYEKEKLIIPKGRTDSGYRLYSRDTLNELKLIQHLKQLGFSLSEIRELKDMCDSPTAKTADVKEKAKVKLAQINEKIQVIMSIKERLETAINLCPGDHSGLTECPIIKSDYPC